MGEGRILIVDDEHAICRAWGRALRTNGYAVAEAHSLREAQQAVRRERFDAIFLDICMPGGRGDGLFETLKELPGRKPAVAITSKYLDAETTRRWYLSCFATVPKPIDPATLLGFAADMTGGAGDRYPAWLTHVAEQYRLSKRSIQVIEAWAVRGLTYAETAKNLGISVSTVRTHWHRVCTKTGCRTKTQVLLLAGRADRR
ncbi:MAG: response regulator transcription factor [Deltaproteobacteria bacterium]|nr:response regulator transcription factor [Deltaproteobacteria bacterium]